MATNNVIQFPEKDLLIFKDEDGKHNGVGHTNYNLSFLPEGNDVVICEDARKDFAEIYDRVPASIFINMCFQFILLNDPYKLDGFNFEQEDNETKEGI